MLCQKALQLSDTCLWHICTLLVPAASTAPRTLSHQLEAAVHCKRAHPHTRTPAHPHTRTPAPLAQPSSRRALTRALELETQHVQGAEGRPRSDIQHAPLCC
jgi:hypothetical protein